MIVPSQTVTCSLAQARIRHKNDSRWAWLAGSVMIVYIVSSPFYLTGNFTVGDAWLAICLLLVMSYRRSAGDMVAFFRSGYFVLSAGVTSCMLASLLFHASFQDAKSLAQILVSLWIVVPIVAVGVAKMPSPLKFLTAANAMYLAVYFLGMILLWRFGIDWLVMNSGADRFFVRFNPGPLVTAGLIISTLRLMGGSKHWLQDVLIVAISTLTVALAASRAGFLVVAVIMAGAVVLTFRKPWQLWTIALIGGAVSLILLSGYVQERLGVLDRMDHFFKDEARWMAIQSSWQTLTSDMGGFMFGAGWGKSGLSITLPGEKAESFFVVAHSMPLEVATEVGVPALLFLLALVTVPVIKVIKCKHVNPTERNFVLLLFGSILVYWLFHPISYLRMDWLGVGILLGVAYRVRSAWVLRRASGLAAECPGRI